MYKKSTKSISSKILNQNEAQNLIVQKLFIDQQKDRINKKFQFPAHFSKARLHKKAVKFGYNAPKISKQSDYNSDINPTSQSSKPVYQQPKVCPCCSQPVNTKQIGVCYNTTSILDDERPFLLNSSASMFFSFIKMAILYMFLVFLICGAFNLLTSVDGNYCNRHPNICQQSFFQLVSTYNKYKDHPKRYLLKIQNILCLVVVVLSIIYFILYRRIQYNLYEDVDVQQQTQDDYTLFVENIPILDFKQDFNLEDNHDLDQLQFNYQQKLKNVFQDQINAWIQWIKEDQNNRNGLIQKDLFKYLDSKGKDIDYLESQNKVTSISLCFDLGQLQKVDKQRQELMQKHINAIKQQNTSGINQDKIKNQIDALNHIQLHLCQKYAQDNSPIFNVTHFVGKAFISFQHQHYREYIMQKYQDKTRTFQYDGNSLILARASHPTDINWTNMKISDFQRLKKILISYLIIAMILVFSAAALIGIDFIKLKGIKSGEVTQPQIIVLNYGLNILASAVTTVINYGISYIISQLTEYQLHQTITRKFSSQIIKTLIAQFINTAFIFYLIQLFNHRPYLSSAGLVVQVSILIVVSGFISVVMEAINIKYWFKRFMLWYNYGYSSYHKKQQIKTYQVKLNKEYQLPVFDIAGRYSHYLLQLYTCMFYCYLVPVGVLGIAILFGIQFWIDKIKMFKMSSEYNSIGYFLSRIILKMFEGSLLIFAIGNIIFSSAIYGDYHVDVINIISLCIAFVYVCFIALAPSSLERKVFANYETFERFSYKECLQTQKFAQTYWTQNPGTVFAKQVDINDNKKFIQQGVIKQICENYLNQTAGIHDQFDEY